MNKEWVLFHLREALGELETTIREMESEADYGYGEFSVAMAHLYHHLNTAWNSRDVSQEAVAGSGEDEFQEWRAFPTDVPLG